MLASRQIETGKCYVNDKGKSARQVLKVDGDNIKFCTYDLKTGKLRGAPNEKCTKDEIIHWADREASNHEASSLDRHELEALYRREDPTLEQGSKQPGDSMAGLVEQARRTNFMR